MSEPVFVWRSQAKSSRLFRGYTAEEFKDPRFETLLDYYSGRNYEFTCPFCRGIYERRVEYSKYSRSTECECRFCGFWWREEEDINCTEIGFSELRIFDINSGDLALEELGCHLGRNLNDIYSLNSRRFEILVGDIFRQLGYSVQLTKQTRDGGFDLVLLRGNNASHIIVECKRYSRHRKITVGLVRNLLGAMLCSGSNEGVLVATTYFTEPARTAARSVNDGASGYRLNLVDIEELSRALGVYNIKLPPRSLVEEVTERLPIKDWGGGSTTPLRWGIK